jgi:hypothetical protein
MGCQQDTRPDVPSAEQIVGPDFIQVFGIRKEASEEFPIEVKASDGQVWYREQTAGMDLADCIPTSLRVAGEEPGCSVLITIRPNARSRIRAWSEKHVGHGLVIFRGGELASLGPLFAPLHSILYIAECQTEKEAEQVIANVRKAAFGDTPKP